ncbi:MAG: bacteriochlorophyll 4-vinyl reductase, partial [Pseudomonadota bacterium]
RARRPREAADWGAEAGRRTADYILAHRIPPRAQALLRAAPARLAAPLLARAIARHAWTFAGSGRFEAQGAWRLVVHDNPMVRGERAAAPLCRWHAAVFERLYRALAADDCRCRELRCGAQPGETACVFEIRRGGDG